MKKYELAKEDYDKGMKYREIADKYGVSINTVKSWKSRKWNVSSEKKVAHKIEKVAHKKEAQPVIDNDELTEQQKLFCLYYLQYFNATKAYQKAFNCTYSTARTEGSRTLAKPNIKVELHRLKSELQQDIFLDVKDLIQEYMKQAFSDITDFTEFGQEIVRFSDGNEGLVSFVRLKDSDTIDGSLIQEVKKGKDGVSVKLYDKQKAMSELMKYLGGDQLREAQIAAAIVKNKDSSEEFDMEDDGFLAALEAEGEELWPEE